jgi:two-component system, chemotaxis family, protein-glutamate methylesterase/glutaminase
MHPKYIIVIGASAGGLSAMTALVTQLDREMNAAVCVVLHGASKGVGNFLTQKLQQHTSLTCVEAANEMLVQQGHVYIAPANQHLLVKENKLLIGYGPEENRWRPSIDVLFRSAAASYDGHTIGIILTGMLNDGSAGMLAIKKSGGVCIVQDPDDAEYPDMPKNALNATEVDYAVPLVQMGDSIKKAMAQMPEEKMPIPPEVLAESRMEERVTTTITAVSQIGEQSVYSCPDCGGGLWHMKEHKLSRYRCHIGHTYTEADLVAKQLEQIESTLWVALRIMEERKQLLGRLEEDTRRKGFGRVAEDHRRKKENLDMHIENMKALLIDSQMGSTG